MSDSSIHVLRKLILALILLGLVSLAADLLLLEHFESASQIVPFASIAVALGALAWHVASGSEASVRGFQVAMIGLALVGLVGVVLHYQGNMAFQLDIEPGLSNWTLFTRVMQAKAPPALAPGAMAQLGLLGLAYAYRHPATLAVRDTSQGDRT
jgi:hypothetical protein